MDIKSTAKRVLARIFDIDSEYLFRPESFTEALEEAAGGSHQVMPQKTLRNRHYGPMPLKVLPKYTGDFLEKLRQAANPENLWDFSMPSEWLKHQEQPHPRDLVDTYYEFNRPGDGAGKDTLEEYHDRGWDEWDAPEMSEDKLLRMRENFPLMDHRLSNVIARYLLDECPCEMDLANTRQAAMLYDLQQTQIYTKKKGWRPPDSAGVTVRLARAEPKVGRWTFYTTSGGERYSTIFQFIPKANTKEVDKLQVRVSCSCPSWLFWGAQYNAYVGDYLYGKIRPKLTKPSKRDPTGRFLICKHALACIPVVRNYRLISIAPDVRDRLRQPPKIEVDKRAPKEPLRIPSELKGFARQPNIKGAVKNWDKMDDKERRSFVMGLESPGEVAFMAHRFPETATQYVAEKLKDMLHHSKKSSDRVWAQRLLRGIL